MKKGSIAWEYMAAVIIVLAVVIILIFGIDVMKDIIKEKFKAMGSFIVAKLGM